jgi:hypothetical protein
MPCDGGDFDIGSSPGPSGLALADGGDFGGGVSGGVGGSTPAPDRTIDSFFLHLGGADQQQQIFMSLMCIGPFLEKKGEALSYWTMDIKDLFTQLPTSLRKTLRLGHAAHYQSQLDAECTSSKYSERSPHWGSLFVEKPANTASEAQRKEYRAWKSRCAYAKWTWRTTRFLPGLLAMRTTQMAKLRNACSQELAYHACCLLVQWRYALKGLHSVFVLAVINEETILQAVEEAQAISACEDFQRQPNMPLDDSIEAHAERAERWRTKQISLWGTVFPPGYRMGDDIGCHLSEREQVRYNRWRFDANILPYCTRPCMGAS